MAVPGVVQAGHRVASGQAEDGLYPQGSIVMQTPFFLARGLDLRPFHPATLNISIAPRSFVLRAPALTFRQVAWTALHPPEDFSFSRCRVHFEGHGYSAWIYYPHPETKARHFQAPVVLEIIAPFIQGLGYGCRVVVEVQPDEVDIV